MNEMTKMVLVFAAGVIVGVLAATSSIFNGEPEAAPVEVVTSNAGTDASAESPAESNNAQGAQSGSDAAMSAAATTQAAEDAPAADPGTTGFEAQTSLEQAEASLAQAEAEAEATLDEAGETAEEMVEDAVEEVAALAEPEEAAPQIFCMQMESTGQCRCYEAETMATADVSAEECAAKLAEE